MSAMPVLKRNVSSANVAAGAKEALTPLNLHFAVVGLLALVNLYLLIHMLFTWRAASTDNAEAIAQQTIMLRSAEIAARPLQGLDVKLTHASADADSFYQTRLPLSYSQVASELGSIAKEDKVKLTRVQYAQAPMLEGTSAELTEVRMDATLSGDYRSLVVFINRLERDKLFFYISNITLTGGQGGVVNLRVRLTTYIRGLGSEEEMKKVALGTDDDDAPKATPTDAGKPAIATPVVAGGAR
jgi:type IV pilus assembly protein PilO